MSTEIYGWGLCSPPAESVTSVHEGLQRAAQFLSVSDYTGPNTVPLPDEALELVPRPSFNIQQAPFSQFFTGIECLDQPSIRVRHAYGQSTLDMLQMLSRKFKNGEAPDYVLFPQTEQDVAKIFLGCRSCNIAAIPRGGGTSVVGGVTTIDLLPLRNKFVGVVVVSLTKLSKPQKFSLNLTNQTITVSPGVTGLEINAYLKDHAPLLQWRHFPQSLEFASVGGMAVTRSGGHFATGKTRIDDWIQAVRLVTPDHGILCLPPDESCHTAHGSGPALLPSIVFGSEGIFGIITSITLQLMPKPVVSKSISFTFPDFLNGIECIRRVLQKTSLLPAQCRLIDSNECLINGLPPANTLLIGFETSVTAEDLSVPAGIVQTIATGCGGIETLSESGDSTKKEGNATQKWRQAFIAAPYLRNDLLRVGIIIETFETAITYDRFSTFHQELIGFVERIVTKEFGEATLVHFSCRITYAYRDGLAPYYTIIIDGRPQNGKTESMFTVIERCALQWANVKNQLTVFLVQNYAAVTNHHAVGRDHCRSFQRQLGSKQIDWMKAVKRHFDARGICNPGVLIPYQTGEIKHAL